MKLATAFCAVGDEADVPSRPFRCVSGDFRYIRTHVSLGSLRSDRLANQADPAVMPQVPQQRRPALASRFGL